jgi:hypothetical protein
MSGSKRNGTVQTNTHICVAPYLGSAERKENEFKEKLSNKSKWLRVSLLHLRFNVEFEINFYTYYLGYCGPGSSVGIETGYVLDGPGIESWWGRDFSHLSRPALGPIQPPVQ